jgi:hypothetical protein
MNETKPNKIAGQRTQKIGDGRTCIERESEDHTLSPGLYKGKTSKEWHDLHEVMRKDFERLLSENETLKKSVRKHEDAVASSHRLETEMSRKVELK